MSTILSERIKMLREEAKMSKSELALQLNVGVSSISQYETGDRVPSDDVKSNIAQLFNVSLDYLMGLSNIRNPYIFFTLSEYFNSLTEKEINEVIKFIMFIKKYRDPQ